MVNLFSVFDPTSFLGLYLNFIVMVLVFLFFPMKYFMKKSKIQSVWVLFMLIMNSMFYEVAFPKYLGIIFISVGTFMYLMMSNMISLFPFVFTSTAHPVMTMGLGIVFWLSFFMMGWVKGFKMSAAHLVPEGSPLLLSPILVVIESISHLIRPFTLSIRLAANMMAGHLIVGLLSMISMISIGGFMMSMLLQSLLLILEFCVAVIQGFVFSILLLLYALEYY